MIDFLSMFSTDDDREQHYVHPIESVDTQAFTLVMKQVEPDFYLAMVVSIENLYSDHSLFCAETVSNMKKSGTMFKEEDNWIL